MYQPDYEKYMQIYILTDTVPVQETFTCFGLDLEAIYIYIHKVVSSYLCDISFL